MRLGAAGTPILNKESVMSSGSIVLITACGCER